MVEFLNSLLPVFERLGAGGYWIIFLVAFLESLTIIGSFVPGTIITLFFGFLASQNFFDIGDLIWFAAAGAILGDVASYYLGRKGTHLFKNENKLLKLSHLEKGEKFFHRHGAKSLLLGRFVAPLRAIIPFIAGLSKMRQRPFWFWAIFGGFFWAAIYLLAGYFFGGALGAAEAWSARIGIFILIFAVFLAVIWLAIKKGKPFYGFIKSILISIKEAVVFNPDVKKFVGRHPRFFNFLKNRLDRKNFSGLTLTFLLASFIYIFAHFVGVIADVVTSETIVSADIRVENLLASFRNPALVKVFYFITVLGDWAIVAGLAIVLSILFFAWKKRHYIVPLFVSLSGSAIFVYIGKIIVHRPRPAGAIPVYIEQSFSFPSGHAAMAAAFYGFIMYFFWKEWPHWKYRLNIVFLWIALSLAVGLSRLYLGVHYLSDVFGGYLVGLLWLIIAITIEERRSFKAKNIKPMEEAKPGMKIKILTGVLLALVPLIYFFSATNEPPQFNAFTPRGGAPVVTAEPAGAFKDYGLNKFSEGLTGISQEPISIIIIAKNENDFESIFARAGWFSADRANLKTILSILKEAILNEPYPAAPMTPSFWNGNVNNYGFEKPTEADTVRKRHHSRFWKTNMEMPDHRFVYVGTASLDIGIKWGVAHKIAPDIDTEREFLFNDLKNTGQIADYKKVDFTDPVLGKNFLGDQFFTDGQAYVIYLK
ncbi:MAG: LssY C-terminal domain-containing protein [bacterium]